MRLTFTGAKPSVRSLTGEELSEYALAFNTADRWQDSAGNDCTFRPVQFLTSVYDDPMKIDMYHLFYNGVSPEQPFPPQNGKSWWTPAMTAMTRRWISSKSPRSRRTTF